MLDSRLQETRIYQEAQEKKAAKYLNDRPSGNLIRVHHAEKE